MLVIASGLESNRGAKAGRCGDSGDRGSGSRLLSNTRSAEPSYSDASGIPVVANAMNHRSAVCPRSETKRGFGFSKANPYEPTGPERRRCQRWRRRRSTTLTAQGGGSGHVAAPALLRQCGDRVTGNCRRFLAVGGEQRTATDSNGQLHSFRAKQARAGRVPCH